MADKLAKRHISIVCRPREQPQLPTMTESCGEAQESGSKRRKQQGSEEMKSLESRAQVFKARKGFRGEESDWGTSVGVAKKSSLGEGSGQPFGVWFNSKAKEEEQSNEAILLGPTDGQRSPSTEFFVRAVRDPEVKFRKPTFAWERPDHAWNYWSFRMHYDDIDMRDEYPDATFESDKRRLEESLQRMQQKAGQAF